MGRICTLCPQYVQCEQPDSLLLNKLLCIHYAVNENKIVLALAHDLPCKIFAIVITVKMS